MTDTRKPRIVDTRYCRQYKTEAKLFVGSLQRKFISTRHETASTAFNRDLDVNASLLSEDGACINEPAVRKVGRGQCLS
jgi:hypothetical protein